MYVSRRITFDNLTNLVPRFRRSEPDLSRKASGRETGYVRYGFLECYFTCEPSNFSGPQPGLMC